MILFGSWWILIGSLWILTGSGQFMFYNLGLIEVISFYNPTHVLSNLETFRSKYYPEQVWMSQIWANAYAEDIPYYQVPNSKNGARVNKLRFGQKFTTHFNL